MAYPFGMLVPNRHGSSNSYRYGFNGMEKDDELKGIGNSYDFGARMLDPRVGRWFKMDPLFQKYPYDSPYMVSGNSPISIMDPDGERKRKITRTITLDNDGTILSIQTDEKIINYNLKSVTRVTGKSSFSDDPVVTYDYYDSVDIEVVVQTKNGELIARKISKDNLVIRYSGETFTPKIALEQIDKVSNEGPGGYSFSDGGGSSNSEYIRKGDRNSSWLDGKGLGDVLLTLLGKDLKKPWSVSHTTKGNTRTPDDAINDFINSISSAVDAYKNKDKDVEIPIREIKISPALGPNGSYKEATISDQKIRDTVLPESKANQMESNYSRIKDSLNRKLENK